VKTYRIEFKKVTYSIDFAVVILFLGVFLDIISTFLFVHYHVGSEVNQVLKDLISISIWFIPVYLAMTNAVFVPFLSTILRKTFSYTFGLISFLLSLNNFSLLIFNNAVLIDTIGFNTLVFLFILFGLTLFAYYVKKQNLNKKETLRMTLNLSLFVLFLGVIHLLFIAITWLANR